MFYSIKRITVQANKAWDVLDNHHIQIKDLLKNYYDGFIDYRQEFGFYNRQVNIKDIPGINDYANRDLYIDDFMGSFVSDTIPTIPTAETRSIFKPKAIRFHDFWDFGFHADNAYQLTGNDNNVVITTKTANGKAIDYLNRVLFLFDNRIVFPTTHGDNLVIDKGMSILNKKDRQYLGVLDFTAVGGFTIEPIVEDRLTLLSQNNVYSQLSFQANTDLTNKTIFLVSNGHLHKLDNQYVVGRDNKVNIRLKHLEIVERAENPREDYDWIKPASGQWGGYRLDSIDCVNYLTRGNSALIIVNHPGLSIHEEYLHRAEMGNSFTHYRVPLGILYLSDGSVGHYKVTDYDFTAVAINTSNPRAFNAISNNDHPLNINVVTLSRSAQAPLIRTAKMIDYYYL